MSTVQVISAFELDGGSKKKIEKVFSAKHPVPPVFEYTVDPGMIGGVLVIDGDNYYDATVKGQLSQLKKTL